MASHQRNRKRLMQWERYYARSVSMNASGPRKMGPYYRGHVMAYDKVSRQGRYYPIGIRQPYVLRWRRRYLG